MLKVDLESVIDIMCRGRIIGLVGKEHRSVNLSRVRDG